jgi:hypothetical protein
MATPEPEYEIVELYPKSYRIIKLVGGCVEAMYRVHYGTCDCISGKVRGYCKHKDWVRNLSKLPSNVSINHPDMFGVLK